MEKSRGQFYSVETVRGPIAEMEKYQTCAVK